MKKKQSRRSRTKYSALEPSLNLKTRYEELTDFDYIHKLNDAEKEFLNKFLEEEVNADFRHSKPLNKTKASRRACYNRNNARNRDIYSRAKASGRFVYMSNLNEGSAVVNEEERLINTLDNKTQLAKVKKNRKNGK